MQGCCLDRMQAIPDGSVDMVLADPPYGTTACKWDSVIPLDKMWEQLKRVIKPNGAIVLTASQPFASKLVCSCMDLFKYQWVWVKTKITGVLNAKRMPVRKHESVLVFYRMQPTYNAQGLVEVNKVTRQGGCSDNYNARSTETYKQRFTNWPRDVLEVASVGKTKHPTQKPVDLMAYLIKTYTHPGDTVLDFTMGSGTTGVAAKQLGRNFIGIELDEGYFKLASQRIAEA